MVFLLRTVRYLPRPNNYTKRVLLQNIRDLSTQLQPQQNQLEKSSTTTTTKKQSSATLDPTFGGVWAQTSAKRDKITELKTELPTGITDLDDVTTDKEKLDLHLTDGFKLIAKAVDESWSFEKNNNTNNDYKEGINVFNKWLLDTNTTITTLEEKNQGLDKEMLDEQSFQRHLTAGNIILKRYIQQINLYDSSFSSIANFVQVNNNDNESDDDTVDIMRSINMNNNKVKITNEEFEKCITFYRLCITKAAIDVLSTNFAKILEITNEDLDRAAVSGDGEMQPYLSKTSLPISKINNILNAYLYGNCIDQCKAWWDMYDKDNDALLDQPEMDNVITTLLSTHQEGLKYIFPTILDTFTIDKSNSNLSWRKRRQHNNHIKKLKKIFSNAADNHFNLEVETPHRLRCMYAWADKKHQDNKMDSILVQNDSSGILGGKKRYVELHPKISYDEFRMEQIKHFSHIDRIGQEIFSSFREDVWVLQGGMRQNKQLRRELYSFFIIVAIADFGILAL